MRKLKLLFAGFALLGGLSANAQTDVTSTYLTNADFSTQVGWTTYVSSGSFRDFNNGLIGTFGVRTSEGQAVSTADETHLATDYCFGVEARWSSNYAAFQQTTSELPVGHYELSFDVENTNPNTTSATYENLFYVQVGENVTTDTKTEWMSGKSSWTTHTISFDIAAASAATISLGYGTGSNNFGSANTPTVHISHLTLTWTDPLKAAKVALQAEIDKANALKGYGYDKEISDLNAAISTAEGVLSTATTEGELTSAKGDLETAESAFVSANSFANGKYLIKNIGTDMFWGAGNSWGTQASLLIYPEYLKLVPQAAPFTYYIETQVNNGGSSYYFNGSYMDNNSPVALTIKRVSDGVYTIANGAKVYGYNGSTTVLGSDIDGATVNGQWNIVSIADATTALSSATSASPTDATFLISDHNFGRNNRDFSSWNVTSGGGDAKKAGDNENMNWQQWNATFNINQTISGLPNGKYTLKAQGFYRPGGNGDANTNKNAKLYAGDDNEIEIVLVSSTHVAAADVSKGLTTENTNEGESYYVPNTQDDASKAFSAGLYENTLENIVVSDGTLKIGAKNEATTGNQWLVVDNFRLYYYGQTISNIATELPAGDMTADEWYYFDVAIDGDYDLTVATLGDIVYTTDAAILAENEATVTDKFAKADELPLTAGRYYVKSSSAQTLTVAPHSFTYEIGAPTLSAADGAYIQNQVLTVTFPSASTNEPGAEPTLAASSTATVNGTPVDLVATTNGFTLDLGTLAPTTDYVVAIPADVYGYAGQSMNAAINLTLHTPTVFDGVYVLYDNVNKLFLGRGCSYGTEASLDKYGVPFNLVTDATGTSSIEFVDWTGVYLFITGTAIFTDNVSTGWKLVPTTGGYYLTNASQSVYATHSTGSYGEYVHTTDAVGSATIWTLKTKAERDEIIAAYPTENINNVIAASGISTTAGEFTTYLSENYNAVDATANIGTATFAGSAGSWTWNGTNRTEKDQPAYGTNFAEIWNATGYYAQTIDKANLPAGIYKVTVQGYERRCANANAEALKAAGYNLVSSYLAANEEQVRFTDWNDVAAKPTNTGNAVTAFDGGEATNVVYIYLDGNTDLTLTVKKPNYIWDCWTIFNNFTLTRYEQTEASMVITDAKYATFVAPFAVAIPSGVTAYTVDDINANRYTLEMTPVETTIPANTPVVVYSESVVDETVYGKNVAGDPKAGLLTGTYTTIAAPNGSYILQKQEKEVAFYQVNTEVAAPNVPANRAYLEAPSTARALYFDAATAIKTIEALTSGEAEIYGANGARQNGLKKGVNIIKRGDKTMKVMVK